MKARTNVTAVCKGRERCVRGGTERGSCADLIRGKCGYRAAVASATGAHFPAYKAQSKLESLRYDICSAGKRVRSVRAARPRPSRGAFFWRLHLIALSLSLVPFVVTNRRIKSRARFHNDNGLGARANSSKLFPNIGPEYLGAKQTSTIFVELKL